MPETTLTFNAWECTRCGHKWIKRNDIKPLRCSGCGNPYWDTPKKKKEDTKDSNGNK